MSDPIVSPVADRAVLEALLERVRKAGAADLAFIAALLFAILAQAPAPTPTAETRG